MHTIEKREQDIKLFEEFLTGKTGVELSKEKGISGNRVSIILSRVRHMLTRPEVVDFLEPGQKPNPDTMVDMCECSVQHAREHKREWAALIAAWRRMVYPGNRKSASISTRSKVSMLGMSIRTMNALAAAGIDTIADLMHRTEEDLVSTHQMGAPAVNEIVVIMAEHGLALRTPNRVFNPPTAVIIDLKSNDAQTDVGLGGVIRKIYQARIAETNTDIDEEKVDDHFATRFSTNKKDVRVQSAKNEFGRRMNACIMGRGVDMWTFETYMALLGKSKITITVE